jgi:histidinol dehydrogenase
MFNEIVGKSKLVEWMSANHLAVSAIDEETFLNVSTIKDSVLANGDQAICDLTQQFDGVDITPDVLSISAEQIASAYERTPKHCVTALTNAAKNIRQYHLNQVPKNWEDQTNDRTYGVQYTPLDAVGLYVPGGRAAYPSSVLMTAIPAVIAGAKRIVMVSPPTGGQIPDSVLVAADISGVTEIYQVGGAQAVFALAYGTSTIDAVDKIVGPGNKFVTAAKQMVYGVVDIDKPAGPSEVCVYVDNSDYAAYAAAEMWAQLEHDPDASAICITNSNECAAAVKSAAKEQLAGLNRQSILNESQANGVIVVVSDRQDALDCINYVASEHLVLLCQNASNLRADVKHAGSIFCGPYSPVTLGDYYAGPNHVLPTARSARFASPLGVMDFMKYSSYLEVSKSELARMAEDIDILTTMEGFDGHNQAVKVRFTS